VADQEVLGYTADNRVQQVQEKCAPGPCLECTGEQNESADRKDPTQSQDGECGCSL